MRYVLRGGNMSEKDPQQFARLLADRLREVCDNLQQEDTDNRQEVFRDGASVCTVCTVF
jgi:hypothetical protein